jgi:hypothetical protein
MALGGMSRPLETRRRRKMMKLRNMVGIAFVAMSLLTGLAVTSASAQEVGLPGCTDYYYCFILDTQTAESHDRDR